MVQDMPNHQDFYFYWRILLQISGQVSKHFTNKFFLCFSYVVDAADKDNLPVSRSELHDLLSKPSLNGIPLLVLGNKIDRPEALSEQDLTEQM